MQKTQRTGQGVDARIPHLPSLWPREWGLSAESRLLTLFVVAVAALLIAGAGGLVHYLFPAAATALGLYLFHRSPFHYVFLSLGLWFFSPLVRRVVDLESGWHAISPVMLAPVLVSGLTVATLLQFPAALNRRTCFPFLLCLLAIGYGLVIGCAHNNVSAAIYQSVTWLVPIAFGLHLRVRRERYAPHRDAILAVFRMGAMVAGVYGIVQFLVMPGWDAFWMENAEIHSIGQPAPGLVRVFGPMNAPNPFATFLMAASLLIVAGAWRATIGAVPVAASFLLTLVRSAWLGFLLGVALLALDAALRARGRILRLALALLVAVWSAVALTLPAMETVSARLSVLVGSETDDSLQSRQLFYVLLLERALLSGVGEGFGATGLATKLDNNGSLGALGNFDSGIMEVLLVLGWPGSFLYLWGVAWISVTIIRPGIAHGDPFLAAAGAIVLGVVSQMFGLNMLVGASGMLFWTFAGIKLAATANVRCSGTS